MNKVDNQEQMGGKPIEELSEEEKNTSSGMYPESNSAGSGEDDPEKSPEEQKPQEEETKEDEPQEPEGEPQKEEEPEETEEEPAPKSGDEEREIKGLQGEENKLKQQLLENIVSLRAQRRQMSQEEAQPQEQTYEDEDMDPEVKKQIDAYMQKHGIVPETQIRQKMQQEQMTGQMSQADKDFFGQYPEYLYSEKIRNEHDGILNSLQKPQTVEEYKKNLNLAHQIVQQQNPDKFPASSGGADNKKQALQTASKGTGSYSAPSSSKQVDPAKVAQAKQLLKGFSDEEIEEFMK